MARFRLGFRTFVLFVALLGEVPIALLLSALLRPVIPHALILTIALCAIVSVPFFIRVERGTGEAAERGLIRPFLLGFYVFWSSSLAGGLLFPLVAICGAALRWPDSVAVKLALVLGGIDGLLGVAWRPRRPRFSEVSIHIDDLPTALDGYRIVQLTDLHIGLHTPPERLRRWVEHINRLAVDLVAVTGDLITSGNDYLSAVATELGQLDARDGVMLALGNHDYFADTERFVRELQAVGIDVLRNRGRVLGAPERRIYVAGVDDTWQRRHNVQQALAEKPRELVALVLAHDPALFPQAAAHDATLVLSGHTHGGQIAFPILPRIFNMARLTHRYTAGHYRIGRSQLYVCRGAGTTGPPIRLGVPAEIAVLTLRRT